jgi:hypothetical protein
VSLRRYKKSNHYDANNPAIYFETLYNDIQDIKRDITIIKEKLKTHQALIWLLLSLIGSVFVKIVFLS